MFVNFAKEQTDEDHFTEVVVSNANSQFNAPPWATTTSRCTTQPQSVPDIPLQQPVTPSDSKEGQSKSGKVKSKNGKSKADQSSDTAMTTLPQAERVEQSSNSSGLKSQGEGSTNKNRIEDACKHPSALFIVNRDTQDSSL